MANDPDANPTGPSRRDPEENEDRRRGFRVEDHRRFAADGRVREAAEAGAPSAPASAASAPAGAASAPAGAAANAGAPSGPIDFSTFLVSLASSGFYHLGHAPHPESGKLEVDLALATQTIDLIELLRHKTEGNRTGEETALIDGLLYELRMLYVERSRSAKAG